LKVKHHVPPPLLDFTLGEVLHNPFDSNQTRMTSLWKYSRRICLMQLAGIFPFR
jgi:hypothetical protein